MLSKSEATKKSKSKSDFCQFAQQIGFRSSLDEMLIKLTLWDSEDWDILWVERDAIYEIMNNYHLAPHQRINHYRNHFELTRKDLMVKNLKRYKKQIEKEGRFDEAAQ